MVCPSSPLYAEASGACHVKVALFAVGLVGAGAALGYFIASRVPRRTNCKVQLGNSKVVDTIDVEDIGDKKVFCRCWKSEKFPYCDGTHGKHNKETGDNLGPLVVKKEA